MAMFNIKTLLSTFDKKGTLMKWLKELTEMLQKSALTGVSVEQTSQTKAVLKFNFDDGSVITSDALDLPRGLPGLPGPVGPQGPQGPKGDTGGADFADVTGFDIITPPAGTVEVSADGITYTGQVNLMSAGTTYNIPAEVTIPLTGGNGISLDADETGHKIVIKLDGGLPSSLPQTYKKKAVTLATAGWAQKAEMLFEGAVNVQSTWTTVAKGDFSKFTIDENFYKKLTAYIGNGGWQKKKSYSNTGAVFYTDNGTSNWMYIKVSPTKIEAHMELGSRYLYKVGLAEENIYQQPYTDADVKVNSEVSFTLDEANGKLAGQFGLKKTIDKEAGKLTFTADTLPTSAITGTLEIGETSTEGAAFVEGITSDISTNANVIYFPPFDNTGGKKRHGLLLGGFVFGSGERERNIDYTQYIDDSKWFNTTALVCSLATPGTVDYKPVVYANWIGTSTGRFLHFALSEAVPDGRTIACEYAYFFIENVT